MIDIIILAMIAVFLLTRLYFIFGTDGKDAEEVRMATKSIKRTPKEPTIEQKRQMEEVMRCVANTECANENNVQLSRIDKALAKIDNFSKDVFLNGASKFFEVVLQAFYSGRLMPIRHLLSKKIYDAFAEAIRLRRENQQTTEVEFICFDKTEIKDVKILKNSVKIVVEFVTQQINILRSSDGQVIRGDENFVQKITDIWTFERSVNAKNNWVLVSTKKD